MVLMREVLLYLEDVKRNLYPRLLSMLLVLVAAAALSGAASFLLCGYAVEGTFAVGSSDYGVKEAVLSCAPMMLTFFFIYISSCTLMGKAALVLTGILRGASMGCFLALAVSGRIYGIGDDWAAGFVISLVETLILLLYGAYSSVYSEPILVTRLSGSGVVSSSLGVEFTKCTLVFSGAVFAVGMVSRWLIL